MPQQSPSDRFRSNLDDRRRNHMVSFEGKSLLGLTTQNLHMQVRTCQNLHMQVRTFQNLHMQVLHRQTQQRLPLIAFRKSKIVSRLTATMDRHPAMVRMMVIAELAITVGMTMVDFGEDISFTTIVTVSNIIALTTTRSVMTNTATTATPVVTKMYAVVTIVDVTTMPIVANIIVAGMSIIVMTTSTTTLRTCHAVEITAAITPVMGPPFLLHSIPRHRHREIGSRYRASSSRLWYSIDRPTPSSPSQWII